MSQCKLLVFVLMLAATAGARAQSPSHFEPCRVYPLSQQGQTVAIGDLNGDGRDDAAVAAWPAALFVLYQQQDGTLGRETILPSPNMPLGIAVADLDNDGRADLAVGGTEGLIYVYYQQPDGSLGNLVPCHAYGATNGLVVEDLDLNGLPDIAITTSSYPAVFAIPQESPGVFGLPTFYPLAGSNARSLRTFDGNSDGRPDLALLLDNTLCWLTCSEFGGLEPPQYLPARGAHSLAAGDVTGDGLDDLVFSVALNQPDAEVGVYASDGGGAFGPLQACPAYDFAQPMVVLDVDGDGSNEVVVAHGGYQALTIFHRNLDGALGASETLWAPSDSDYQPGALAVGDLNADGRPDLALADRWNGLVVYLHTATGDAVAPTCLARLSGSQGFGGWYTSAVQVSLEAQDEPGGSGIQSLFYRFGGGEWVVYAGPLSVSSEGTTPISFYAIDAAGNASAEQQVEVNVDTHAPSLRLVPADNTLWPPAGQTVEMRVEAAGFDAMSGVASLHLSVKDEYGLVEPEMEVTGSLVAVPLVASRSSADKDGRVYTLVLTGTDAAGNVAQVTSTVTVPAGSPNKPKPPKEPKAAGKKAQ